MPNLELNGKYFVCEVYGESNANPETMGIESDNETVFAV
jgi:hypothetical protein